MRRQIRNPDDTITSFLARELPQARREDAEFLTKAIKEAGERYDRYDQARSEWEKYGPRKRRLGVLKAGAERLGGVLSSLDILTRDDLASRIGPERIDSLLGLLLLLWERAGELEKEIQDRGKPTDHATQRWILEMADIYENAFSTPPTISGSGEDSAERRGRFYRLLELGRPSRFARHGRLSLKHTQKLLKSRNRLRSEDFSAFVKVHSDSASNSS